MDYSRSEYKNFMTIICANPKAQFDEHKKEINDAIAEVTSSGIFINGEKTKLLEHSFANFIGTKYSIGVSSGTAAIELVLRGLNLENGDEVITVSHTAIPTISAIRLAGMRPKLVDINPHTYTMCPESLKRSITEKTKVVIVVHLYGQGAFIEEIKDICASHNIYLIEDCSQAHGATWKGRKLGSFGIASCFSCYPTKNLGALGDAGLVATNNKNLAETIVMQREYGWRERGVSVINGGNYRIDEIQAAVLGVKLKYLEGFNCKRKNIADFYNSKLSGRVCLPHVSKHSDHVYHLYVIQLDSRDKVLDELKARDIYAGIHYYPACHKQTIYRGLESESLTNTERVSQRILSLPIYPELKIEQVDYVSEKLLEIID